MADTDAIAEFLDAVYGTAPTQAVVAAFGIHPDGRWGAEPEYKELRVAWPGARDRVVAWAAAADDAGGNVFCWLPAGDAHALDPRTTGPVANVDGWPVRIPAAAFRGSTRPSVGIHAADKATPTDPAPSIVVDAGDGTHELHWLLTRPVHPGTLAALGLPFRLRHLVGRSFFLAGPIGTFRVPGTTNHIAGSPVIATTLDTGVAYEPGDLAAAL